jgi:hypothetical protein
LKRAQKRDQRSIHSTPQTETRMISGVF